mmetsp:Transcript_33686/g.60966  ORF Transcript_33686/g.60966 Transcript_33686/m.60966 type:complete len:118 (+) Transcript_33686:49-402(+)
MGVQRLAALASALVFMVAADVGKDSGMEVGSGGVEARAHMEARRNSIRREVGHLEADSAHAPNNKCTQDSQCDGCTSLSKNDCLKGCFRHSDTTKRQCEWRTQQEDRCVEMNGAAFC